MAFTRITNSELNSRGATTLADQPNISASLLKQEFDAPAKEVVAPAVNHLMDELEANTAATNIGAYKEVWSGNPPSPVLIDTTVEDLLLEHGDSIKGVSDELDDFEEIFEPVAELAHTHENKEVLDKFGESGGKPTYDGNPIGAQPTPVMIQITTPPTKTIYKVGEQLDLTGIVVKLIGTEGMSIEVTSACTFSPANGTILTSSDTSVTVSYHYAEGNLDFTTSLAITVRELLSIAVTTPPIKTAYQVGDTLDLTGIVVTATYSDGYTANVTADCVFDPANGTVLTAADTSVDITYVEGSVTKTASVAIGVKELLSIAVTHLPTTTSYVAGETLDLTGLVVTATYDDSSTLDVTNRCTFSPDDGDTLTTSDTSISISYTEGSITKTTSQVIIVEPAVYGVEWDGTAPSAFTRTDAATNFVDPVPYQPDMSGSPSSPFDDIYPWSEMVRVTDANAGVLVKIPKFYYKLDVSNGFKLQICKEKKDNTWLTSPAHQDRGDGEGERDLVYVGAYISNRDDYKSSSGKNLNYATRANSRTIISNLGSDIWLYDIAMFKTIQMLYLVEFADWDIEKTLGTYDWSNMNETGVCDSFNYHTGMSLELGSTNGARRHKYRNIEDLCTNYPEWIDGLYISNSKLYAIKNPANFSDSTGGVDTGLMGTFTGSNIIKKWAKSQATGYEWLFMPSEVVAVTGNDYYYDSTYEDNYVCDGVVFTTNHNVTFLSKPSDLRRTNTTYGLFSLCSTTTNAQQCYRIMKLPSNS